MTEAETARIRAAMAHYPDPAAAAVEALKIVQEHHGWVSDENLAAVADLLGMSPEALDGVATFYNLIFRKPVGRTVILCCDSVSCWLMGSDRIFTHLSRRLGIEPGETTPDGRYTLLPICCLGACDRAPVLLAGGELHGDLDETALDAWLREHHG
jgi:NADH-quinone oxidoreductase subunit E